MTFEPHKVESYQCKKVIARETIWNSRSTKYYWYYTYIICIPCNANSEQRCFNPFPNKSWFLRVYSASILKTLQEKEKLLVTSNFSFFNSVFYPHRELFPHFHQLRNCCLQTLSVWESLKFVVWEMVKESNMNKVKYSLSILANILEWLNSWKIKFF